MSRSLSAVYGLLGILSCGGIKIWNTITVSAALLSLIFSLIFGKYFGLTGIIFIWSIIEVLISLVSFYFFNKLSLEKEY
jgi:uncharacterized oligopeptide transporter (OPT) family protein